LATPTENSDKMKLTIGDIFKVFKTLFQMHKFASRSC